MYGMINQAIKDLVCHQAGEDIWLEICRETEMDPEGFEALTPYPDRLTYKLVGAAAKRLETTQEELLKRFGRHWIIYTGEQGYGEVMRLFGKDFRSCLANLNRMHGHMGAMMPQLKPPRFTVTEDSPESITVHYYSEREGLGPMVVGLLEGLAEKYDEKVRVAFSPKGGPQEHDIFKVLFE
jgi:hypothetical protein